MSTNYLSFVFLAMVVSFVSTPLISRVAVKNGVVDLPGDRKAHHEAKPLMGGLSFFLAAVVAVPVFYPVTPQILSLISGALIIVTVGILDDIKDLRPLYKLAGQLAAALVLVLFNLENFGVLLEFLNRLLIPGFVTVILITGWVVLMINALNLIDGLDGLAAGTALIIAGALAAVALIKGNYWLLGLTLITGGAVLGFLPYNAHKARIFMGDAGSMLLGYFLAALHLFAVTSPFSASLVLGSAFIFAYPALDVSYAIYRRLRDRGSIFKGDRGHIHHILLNLGLPMPKVVLFLCLFNLFFAGLGVLLLSARLDSWTVLALGLLSLVSVLYLFKTLNRIGGRDSQRNA